MRQANPPSIYFFPFLWNVHGMTEAAAAILPVIEKDYDDHTST